MPTMPPMRSKPHLLQLANSQEQDPVAKAVSAEVTAAMHASLGWSDEHARGHRRAGGLIHGQGNFTSQGQKHFKQLLARISNSLRGQPQFRTRYPTVAGVHAPEGSEERQLAQEQAYEWLKARMTQRQQHDAKRKSSTSGGCCFKANLHTCSPVAYTQASGCGF